MTIQRYRRLLAAALCAAGCAGAASTASAGAFEFRAVYASGGFGSSPEVGSGSEIVGTLVYDETRPANTTGVDGSGEPDEVVYLDAITALTFSIDGVDTGPVAAGDIQIFDQAGGDGVNIFFDDAGSFGGTALGGGLLLFRGPATSFSGLGIDVLTTPAFSAMLADGADEVVFFDHTARFAMREATVNGVAPVPAPAALPLLAGALGTLLLRRRRARTAR